MQDYDAIIIGAGYAGLGAALELKKAGLSDILVIEKNDYIGGRCGNVSRDGIMFPTGQEFVTRHYKSLWELCQQFEFTLTPLSLEDMLLDNPYPDIDRGRPQRIRPQNILGSFVFGRTLSPLRKISMILRAPELVYRTLLHQNPRPSLFEVSASAMGEPLAELIADTAIRATWAHSAKEADAGYFLRWLRNVARGNVYTIDGGIGLLPKRIAGLIGEEHFLLDTEVTEVTREGDSVSLTCRHNGESSAFKTRQLVVTTTGNAALKMLHGVGDDTEEFLKGVRYSSYQRVCCATEEAFPHSYILVPERRNTHIAGMTKIAQTDKAYFTVSLMAKAMREAMGRGASNDELKEVLESLDIHAISGMVEDFRVLGGVYWDEALPIFSSDHLERVERYTSYLAAHPQENIVIAGDMLGGPYSEGAFRSGIAAGRRTVKNLR